MTTPHPRIPDAAVDSLLLDSSPYLSCDDCFEQMDSYVERVLADPSHQDLPLQVHLQACGACAEEAAALIELLSDDAR